MKKKHLEPIIIVVVAVSLGAVYLLKDKINSAIGGENPKVEQSNTASQEGTPKLDQDQGTLNTDLQENSLDVNTKEDTLSTANEQNKEIKETVNNTNSNSNAKSLSKNDAVSKVLKKEKGNKPIPKNLIPVKATNGNYSKLEKVASSNTFLCNDNNKLDNGMIIELPNYNENNQTNNFVAKDYDAVKKSGKGLLNKGTISRSGEVAYSK